jgi:hypothetical protein
MVASLKATTVRARSVRRTPGAARWFFAFLAFANCQLLFAFLVPRLPAVGDLGQDLLQALDIALAPEAHSHPAGHRFRRRRNLAGFDVATQAGITYPNQSGNLFRGEFYHFVRYLTDRFENVKNFLRGRLRSGSPERAAGNSFDGAGRAT